VINWRGLYTVFRKEVMRFLKVTVQTVLTPVVTALLYLLVFAQVLEEHVQIYPGIPYTAFLIPGLTMMSVIQNAFANSSSSLIQSKMTGNLVFLLLSPVSPGEFMVAFVAAAVVRGLLVGAGVFLVAQFFITLPVSHVGWALLFAAMGSAFLGTLGVVAGVSSDKFEQLAAFQNFVVLPLSFLSGVFYSIHSLPSLWEQVSRFNPFFYMIDGFRYGILGVSDVSPWVSLAVGGTFVLVVMAICLVMLRTGYKLRQ